MSISSFRSHEGDGAVVSKPLREITDAASKTPCLIEHLGTPQINGDWVSWAIGKRSRKPTADDEGGSIQSLPNEIFVDYLQAIAGLMAYAAIGNHIRILQNRVLPIFDFR